MSKLSAFIMLVLVGPVLLAAADAATGPIHSWDKVEIVLTAARDYPNPYFDSAHGQVDRRWGIPARSGPTLRVCFRFPPAPMPIRIGA